MSSPMRLDSSLVAAAKREGAMQKRSIPKQIEFWAELGKAVEHVIGIEDIIAVTQGLKKIKVEPVLSVSVNPDDIFDSLETSRKKGTLSKKVPSAAVYFETSKSQPGLLDRVDSVSGGRKTGQFVGGEFKVQE